MDRKITIVQDSDPDSSTTLAALKPVIDELKQYALGYPNLDLKEPPRFNELNTKPVPVMILDSIPMHKPSVIGEVKLNVVKQRRK